MILLTKILNNPKATSLILNAESAILNRDNKCLEIISLSTLKVDLFDTVNNDYKTCDIADLKCSLHFGEVCGGNLGSIPVIPVMVYDFINKYLIVRETGVDYTAFMVLLRKNFRWKTEGNHIIFNGCYEYELKTKENIDMALCKVVLLA